MAGPTPPPPLIDASEARNHFRQHRRVRGTVTEIAPNRRGDVILRFGFAQEVFKGVIPASSVLSKEEEWINSLNNRTLTVSGLISFYAQAPAMRILEKNQVTLPEESKQISGLDTLRRTIIARAGRLTRPQGKLTLTLNANPIVQHALLRLLRA